MLLYDPVIAGWWAVVAVLLLGKWVVLRAWQREDFGKPWEQLLDALVIVGCTSYLWFDPLYAFHVTLHHSPLPVAVCAATFAAACLRLGHRAFRKRRRALYAVLDVAADGGTAALLLSLLLVSY